MTRQIFDSLLSGANSWSRSTSLWRSMPTESKSLLSGANSCSRSPPVRRLSSISAFGSDEPIPQKKDEFERRRASWVQPDRLEDSHLIAVSKWGAQLERWIMPFAFETLEGWALYMLVFALVLTMPFGVHRLLFGWWDHRIFPLQAANFVLEIVGLPPLFGGETIYFHYNTEELSPGIDFSFALHIFTGILWLLCGFTVFYTVNKRSKKAHRRLAQVSGLVLSLHLVTVIYNLYVNAVKHPLLSRMLLLEEVFVVSALVAGGVSAARNKEFQRHQDIMIRAFVLSVEGAGTIRFSGYIIWMIGRAFTPEAAAYFEAGACLERSASSPMGINSRDCQGPYLLRMHAMRLVSCYHQALYLKLPEKVGDAASRARLREEIRSTLTWTAAGIAIVAASYQLDHDLASWNRYIDMIRPEVKLGVSVFLALGYFHEIYKHSHRVLSMPRRNAVIPGRTSQLMAERKAS